MMFKEEIEKMNIAFDFSKRYTVARVPLNYNSADGFALECVYSLRSYVADKCNIDTTKVILVAISKNNKVVVLCDNDRYRSWLWDDFHQPSIGSAQLYDNVKPELILQRLNLLFR